MDPDAVRERASDLPTEPGVYQFRADGGTLYVGKAVDLRDRVRSYGSPRSERIARMVEGADDLEVAVTDTETQALLLEANLIKRHQPRYNVRLTDDKSYPLVQLTDHEAPRIEVTRDPDPGAEVFGPFTNVGRAETAVKAIREVYGLRGCSDHKYADRDRPCLDYEMGLCTAPCTREISVEAYREDVAAARRYLGGEVAALADPLGRAMDRAAEAEQFERAANLRDRLRAVERLHEGGGDVVETAAADAHAETLDVLGVALDAPTRGPIAEASDSERHAVVARLHAEGGKLVDRDRHRVAVPSRAGAADDRAAVLAAFVPQFYADRPLPDAVLAPVDPRDPDLRAWLDREGVALRVPGAGREARLVDLALKNARRGRERSDGTGALAAALGLDSAEWIEGFDVSHAGGRGVVGSDVAFVDGHPHKPGYRRRKLDEGNDDPARIRALLEWRARRAIEGRDDRPDPDLLVIDGGEPQLTAALAALDEVGWDRPVVALAKGPDRDGDRAVTADGARGLDSDGPALNLLRRVRDEAHRFAVAYHRTVRDDVSTALDDVDGVGPERRKRLLRRFGSVEGVRTASVDELCAVEGIGAATAEQIRRRL